MFTSHSASWLFIRKKNLVHNRIFKTCRKVNLKENNSTKEDYGRDSPTTGSLVVPVNSIKPTRLEPTQKSPYPLFLEILLLTMDKAPLSWKYFRKVNFESASVVCPVWLLKERICSFIIQHLKTLLNRKPISHRTSKFSNQVLKAENFEGQVSMSSLMNGKSRCLQMWSWFIRVHNSAIKKLSLTGLKLMIKSSTTIGTSHLERVKRPVFDWQSLESAKSAGRFWGG